MIPIPICEVDGEQVFVDDEPVYGLQIVAENQLIQFIPAMPIFGEYWIFVQWVNCNFYTL